MFRSAKCLLVLVVLVFGVPSLARGDAEPLAESVSSIDAGRFVGKTVTVCGPVAGTAYFPHLKGEPTFINFDRQYPEQSFTVVIWGQFRERFERSPDRLYKDRDLCVTGLVETYKGKPQIIVTAPDQITIRDTGLVAERFSYEERVLLKAMLAELGYAVDEGTGEWSPEADAALLAFQEEREVGDDGGRSPRTLRALAEAVDRIPAESHQRILRLLLLNLAQREEAARK